MKKTSKFWGAIAIVAMTIIGCAKEIDAPQEAITEETQGKVAETHTITITTGSPETKTSIVAGGSSASFKWSSDDATRFHIFENDVEGSSVALETNDEYVTVKLTATFATVDAASYTYSAFLAKNVFDDAYPQVPSAQTCTGSSYDPNADILIAKPVTNEGSVLAKLNMQFGRPCVINKMTFKGLTAGETLTTVEINSDKALTGHYDIEGKEWTDESKRITLTTSQTVPASGEVVVYFVTKPIDAATLTVTAITDAHVYDKTFTKTINFVLDQVTVFGVSSLTQYTKRDVLTRRLTGVAENAGYTDFNSKGYTGDGHSSAIYAGTIAGGKNAIQLNANSGTSYRGIVTTTSGGSLKKVRVTWNTESTDTRAITAYGKNTAYTTADLNNSFGTEIGSITKGSAVELAVASYYEYLMLKSTAAIYLDEIVLFWGDGKTNSGLKWTADGNSGDAVTAADASIETGDDILPTAALYNPNGISVSNITFSSSNTDVATIGEHTGAITLVAEGDTEIHAVFAGDATYKPADVYYTLSVANNRTACATPSFSPAAGSVAADTEVTVSSNTVGSTLYYTLDGSTPTTSSPSYSTLVDGSGKPYVIITIDQAKTIKAIAVKDDWNTSDVASASYTISGLAAPLPDPAGLAITVLNANTFTATWTNDTNATDYEWIVSTSSTYAGIKHDGADKNVIIEGTRSSTEYSLSAGVCTVTKSGLSLSGEYYFYVKAKGDGTTYSDSVNSSATSGIYLSFPFSSNITGWPTTSGNAAAGSYTYTLGGNNYTYSHTKTGNGIYCNTSYLMVVSGNYLGLPAISGYKLKTVAAQLNSGGSPSTKSQGKITSNTSGTAVSGGTAQTWSSKGKVNTYNLSGTSANTVYYLGVSSANFQCIKIELTYVK